MFLTFRRKQLGRYQGNETNLPTKQQQAKKDARLQGADVKQRRAPGAQAKARQGAQKADGEWLRKTPKVFPSDSGS